MKATVLLVFLFGEAVYGYLESAGVNGAADKEVISTRISQKFIPQVAFKCGYRNKYMTKEGFWATDTDKYATCLENKGKLDILKYCRKVYPKLVITNIVREDHLSNIHDWCKESGTPCKWQFTVRAFRCVVGEFQSEALLVPNGCRFGHVDDQNICEKFEYWKDTSEKECAKRNGGMDVRSFAMLSPCGLEMFSGVEFVCCDKAGTKKVEETKTVDLGVHAKLEKEDKKTEEAEYDDEDDEDDEEYDEDEDDDEDYDDEDEDEDETKEEKDKTDSNKKDDFSDDAYFRSADPDKEHENYKKAIARLEKQHKQKVAKVMREWSELDNRYITMKKTDPKHAEEFKKEMTSNFQKTVAALEEENLEERRQLDDVHTQRVQASLNEKKRITIKAFRDAMALSHDSPQPHKVLKTLQAYIRSEEKDRVHSLNHYRHLLKVDPQRAAEQKNSLLTRLRDIDLRIEATIAILHDIPALEDKVKAVVSEFWRTFRKENTQGIDDNDGYLLRGNDANKKLLEFYERRIQQEQRSHQPIIKESESNVETVEVRGWDKAAKTEEKKEEEEEERVEIGGHLDRPHQSHARRDPLAHSHQVHVSSSSNKSSGGGGGMMLLGVGGLVALVVILAGVLIARKRSSRGFEKVNTNSPEEQHVSGMQVNGYENPTYHYFEKP